MVYRPKYVFYLTAWYYRIKLKCTYKVKSRFVISVGHEVTTLM